MYFLISRMLDKFRFINYSLVIILAFVGLKMLFSSYIHLPEWVSLTVISVALIGGIVALAERILTRPLEESAHFLNTYSIETFIDQRFFQLKVID